MATLPSSFLTAADDMGALSLKGLEASEARLPKQVSSISRMGIGNGENSAPPTEIHFP